MLQKKKEEAGGNVGDACSWRRGMTFEHHILPKKGTLLAVVLVTTDDRLR